MADLMTVTDANNSTFAHTQSNLPGATNATLAPATMHGSQAGGPQDEKVVDAEYTEVDDKNNKKSA